LQAAGVWENLGIELGFRTRPLPSVHILLSVLSARAIRADHGLAFPTTRETLAPQRIPRKIMSEEKKLVIVAHITHIDCPICESPQEGFVNEPRGGNFTCTECKKPFLVPTAAEIDFG
jgi:hypothetical protein